MNYGLDDARSYLLSISKPEEEKTPLHQRSLWLCWRYYYKKDECKGCKYLKNCKEAFRLYCRY